MLLSELFELYHRENLAQDPGSGLRELVTMARDAGLCREQMGEFDDLAFDPESE